MNKGWVPISRHIQDHWLWKDKPFDKARAWIDLILLANHEEIKAPVKNEIVTYERGTVTTSITALAERWGWSRHKVRDFIDLLNRDGMLTSKRTANRTVLVLENYAFYNDVGTEKGQKKDEKRTEKGQSADTNNNDNNENNIYIYNNKKGFSAPTVEEVRAYCEERCNSIDAEAFVDYYESKGWLVGKSKMKDWRAAVRTWERRGTTAPKRSPQRTPHRCSETPADDLDDLF